MNNKKILTFLIAFIFIINIFKYYNIIEPANFKRKFMIKAYKKHNILYDFKKKILSNDNKTISYINNLNPLSSNKNCIKDITSTKLSEQNIPVPKFYIWDFSKSIDDNINIIKSKISFPLVIKPTTGTQGKNVYVNISSTDDIHKISKKLIKLYNKKKIKNIMVEKQVYGDNYRILILHDKIIGALKRTEPYVLGNGIDMLKDLIQKYNKSQKDKKLHPVYNLTDNIIFEQGYTYNSIIPLNKKVIISNTTNFHNGAKLVNIPISKIHPINIDMFLKINKILNLNLSGIDYMSSSLNIPYTMEGHVIEVNENPDMNMHNLIDNSVADNFMKNLF